MNLLYRSFRGDFNIFLYGTWGVTYFYFWNKKIPRGNLPQGIVVFNYESMKLFVVRFINCLSFRFFSFLTMLIMLIFRFFRIFN